MFQRWFVCECSCNTIRGGIWPLACWEESAQTSEAGPLQESASDEYVHPKRRGHFMHTHAGVKSVIGLGSCPWQRSTCWRLGGGDIVRLGNICLLVLLQVGTIGGRVEEWVTIGGAEGSCDPAYLATVTSVVGATPCYTPRAHDKIGGMWFLSHTIWMWLNTGQSWLKKKKLSYYRLHKFSL